MNTRKAVLVSAAAVLLGAAVAYAQAIYPTPGLAGTVIGPELISNGRFESSLTGWSGAGWGWSSGKALHTAGSTTALSQSALAPVTGTEYRVTYTISDMTTGTLTLSMGSVTKTARSSNGTYADWVTAADNTAIAFTPSSSFNGALDNVEVSTVSVGTLVADGTTTLHGPLVLHGPTSLATNSTLTTPIEVYTPSGTNVISIGAVNTTLRTPIAMFSGSANSPAIQFGNGTYGVMFYDVAGATGVTVATNGQNGVIFESDAVQVQKDMEFRWSDSTSDSASNAIGVAGIKYVADGVIAPTNGNGGIAFIQNTKGDLVISSGNYTNSTASLTAVSALQATGLVAGRKYSFTLTLFLIDSTAAEGAQFDFGNSGSASTFRSHCVHYDNTAAVLKSTQVTSLTAIADSVTSTGTGDNMVTCSGYLVLGSGQSFGIRAAQVSHTSGTLTIYVGSNLRVQDMP